MVICNFIYVSKSITALTNAGNPVTPMAIPTLACITTFCNT